LRDDPAGAETAEDLNCQDLAGCVEIHDAVFDLQRSVDRRVPKNARQGPSLSDSLFRTPRKQFVSQ